MASQMAGSRMATPTLGRKDAGTDLINICFYQIWESPFLKPLFGKTLKRY